MDRRDFLRGATGVGLLAGLGGVAEGDEPPIAESPPARHFDLPGRVYDVTFVDEGRSHAVATEKGVRWLDPATGRETHCIDPTTPTFCVDPSPDGKELVVGLRSKNVRVVEARTGVVRLKLSGHTLQAPNARFSPDGKRIATACDDGLVRLWDAASGRMLQVLAGHGAGGIDLAFSPLRTRLASSDRSGLCILWDVSKPQATERKRRADPGAWASLAFSPDGRAVAWGVRDKGVRVSSTLDLVPRSLLESDRFNLGRLAYSPDGRLLAIGSKDSGGMIRDVASGRPLALLAPKSRHVYSFAFSPDGRWLAAGSLSPGSIGLWDLHTLLPRVP